MLQHFLLKSTDVLSDYYCIIIYHSLLVACCIKNQYINVVEWSANVSPLTVLENIMENKILMEYFAQA